MRGNQPGGLCTIHYTRSIPAYAGEPWDAETWQAEITVYPRVCGGTPGGRSGVQSGGGLSPRMRGNPRRSPCQCGAAGSIPAYAGEPPPDICMPRPYSVYPRVCGGTAPALP